MSIKLATNIVEIPVASIEQPGNITCSEAKNTSTRKFSIDLDGFLNQEYADIVAQNVDAPVKPSFPSSATAIRRQESNDSVSSTSSFFSVEFDDYQQTLLDDLGDDLFGMSFPQSPSIEDLSRNFTALGKTPDEEVQNNFQRSQKSEKVENNDDSSASSESGSDSDSGSVSDPVAIKKEIEMEEQELAEEDQEGVHDEPDVKDEDDEEYRPVKRRILGIGKNESFSSVSSYSSGASDSDELDDEDEYDEEEEDEGYKGVAYEPNSKRYKQPLSLRADGLKIGDWSLKDFAHEVSDEGLALDVSFDIKILFGRRKIKYEIVKPSGPKNKATLVMDFCFSSIIGLDFKTKDQLMVFQLSEPPIFSKKEKGKCGKVSDFTGGNASKHPRHYIYVQSMANYSEYMERLLSCDRRLRQLAKVGVVGTETPFPESTNNSGAPICDWDKEGKATKHCETCKANYCDLCDEVIHRQASHKAHKRSPVVVVVKPLPPPKPKRPTIKKRKKVNSDRCRCGTGATKGTLGEPCTGNRCPCFSNGKSCVSCGCKNCANPIRKTRPGGGSRLAQEALRV